MKYSADRYNQEKSAEKIIVLSVTTAAINMVSRFSPDWTCPMPQPHDFTPDMPHTAIVNGLGLPAQENDGEGLTDGIVMVLGKMSHEELEPLAAAVEKLDGDSKITVVAVLEHCIEPVREHEYGDDEIPDIVRAAFAAAPVAIGFDFFEDTTDAVEYIMDCIVEGEDDLNYLRGNAVAVITENHDQGSDRELMVWLGQHTDDLMNHTEELSSMGELSRAKCAAMITSEGGGPV